MFLLVEGEEEGVVVQDCVVVQHLGVDLRATGDEADEVAEMRVRDVDHGRDGEEGRLGRYWVSLGDRVGLLFHCISFIRSTIAIKRDCRPTLTNTPKTTI